jgi:plastocyanin
MYKVRVLAVAALVAVAGCGGGGDDGGGTTTGPAVFTTLSVDPASVSVLVNGTQALTATAKDQNGASMSGLTTTYASDNQSVATVSTGGVVTGVAVGTARVTASGTVGTVTKTATVNVTVAVAGATASVDATISDSFSPKTVAITKGGTVTWTFAKTHNVTFDTQGAPSNIPDKASGSSTLTFPSSGTFQYHCTIHGPSMNGTVVVQ